MRNPDSVVSTLEDVQGHTVAEVYKSTSNRQPCYRYRILGANGEFMAPSEPYTTIQNAQRGVFDLSVRLQVAPRSVWKGV